MIRRIHRVLRRLLPPEFRRHHGAEMEDVFVEAHQGAKRRGGVAVMTLWVRELIDLAVTGRGLRTDARRYGAEFEIGRAHV